MSFGKLLERIIQLIPVLLGVSLIVFVMLALTPGDPVQIMVGEQSITPEQEADAALWPGFLPSALVNRVGNFRLAASMRRKSTLASRARMRALTPPWSLSTWACSRVSPAMDQSPSSSRLRQA